MPTLATSKASSDLAFQDSGAQSMASDTTEGTPTDIPSAVTMLNDSVYETWINKSILLTTSLNSPHGFQGDFNSWKPSIFIHIWFIAFRRVLTPPSSLPELT